jgi:hypothetical protein
MNKADVKYIKQIAGRLPVVYEETVSGFYVEEGQNVPNVVQHPINHTRRMRKAFEKSGMDGIRGYLEYINSLQLKRRDNVGL